MSTTESQTASKGADKPHDFRDDQFAKPTKIMSELNFQKFDKNCEKFETRTIHIYEGEQAKKIVELVKDQERGTHMHKGKGVEIKNQSLKIYLKCTTTDDSLTDTSLFTSPVGSSSSITETPLSTSSDSQVPIDDSLTASDSQVPIDLKLQEIAKLQQFKLDIENFETKFSLSSSEMKNVSAENVCEVYLFIETKSTVSETMTGLYSVTFKDEDGHEVFYMVSQNEATNCSKIFPLVDQPAVKFHSQTTVILPNRENLKAYSNEQLKEEPYLYRHNQKAWVFDELEFEISPHLYAVLLGDFECAELVSYSEIKEYIPKFKDTGRPYQVYGIVPNSNFDKYRKEIQYLIYCGYVSLILLDLIGQPYPLEVLDLAAIHKFAAGAMENPGLVTFRISVALLDKTITKEDDREYQMGEIRKVLGHELAHNIYGFKLTCKDFENIGVAESLNVEIWFSLFMEIIMRYIEKSKNQDLQIYITEYLTEKETRQSADNYVQKELLVKRSQMFEGFTSTALAPEGDLTSASQELMFNQNTYETGQVFHGSLFYYRAIKHSHLMNPTLEIFKFLCGLREDVKEPYKVMTMKEYALKVLLNKKLSSQTTSIQSSVESSVESSIESSVGSTVESSVEPSVESSLSEYVDNVLTENPTITIINCEKNGDYYTLSHHKGFKKRITLVFLTNVKDATTSAKAKLLTGDEEIQIEKSTIPTSLYGVYAVKYQPEVICKIVNEIKNVMVTNLILMETQYIFRRGCYENYRAFFEVTTDCPEIIRRIQSEIYAFMECFKSEPKYYTGKTYDDIKKLLENVRQASADFSNGNMVTTCQKNLLKTIEKKRESGESGELQVNLKDLVECASALNTSHLASFMCNVSIVLPSFVRYIANLLNGTDSELKKNFVKAIMKLPIIDFQSCICFAQQRLGTDTNLIEFLQKLETEDEKPEKALNDAKMVLEQNEKIWGELRKKVQKVQRKKEESSSFTSDSEEHLNSFEI